MKERKKDYYSIGDVSKICNVSRKAMRFYDEIGLIKPDKVGSNNYRYYSREALLNLTILKYYKQMGFKLEEMRALMDTEEYQVIEHGFLEKIRELREEATAIQDKLTSVSDWYDLLLEAQTVILNNATEVSIKYIEPEEYGCMEQAYNADSKEACINLDWTEHLDEINCEIAGAVMIVFPSYKERMQDTCETMRIMQKMIRPGRKSQTIRMGGGMFLSCYHIGPHTTLNRTYEKMIDWAAEHNYKLGEEAWERYVTDYWTTKNEEMFVTEIRLQVFR